MKEGFRGIRKLIRIGNAQGVSLPKSWIETNNIKIGDSFAIKVKPIKKPKNEV